MRYWLWLHIAILMLIIAMIMNWHRKYQPNLLSNCQLHTWCTWSAGTSTHVTGDTKVWLLLPIKYNKIPIIQNSINRIRHIKAWVIEKSLLSVILKHRKSYLEHQIRCTKISSMAQCDARFQSRSGQYPTQIQIELWI